MDNKVLFRDMWTHRATLIFMSMALSQICKLTLRDHGSGANASIGVSVPGFRSYTFCLYRKNGQAELNRVADKIPRWCKHNSNPRMVISVLTGPDVG